MKYSFYLVAVFSFCATMAQSRLDDKHFRISFLFLNAQSKDSADLKLLVIFKNKSKSVDSIYQYFKDGYLNDENFNMNIQLEKLKGAKYLYYPLYYYQNLIPNNQRPFDKCIDLPKKLIAPLSSDTIVYNLLQSGKLFEEGKYRFKVHVRTGCSLERGRGTPENPSFPKIRYTESKWIYFVVKKTIYAKN